MRRMRNARIFCKKNSRQETRNPWKDFWFLIVFVTTHCLHVSKVIAAAYKEGTAHEVS